MHGPAGRVKSIYFQEYLWSISLNPFLPNATSLYPLKISKNRKERKGKGVLKPQRKGVLWTNGLIKFHLKVPGVNPCLFEGKQR